MPLSKARMRERKRLDRLNVKPKSEVVKPKLLWYAGSADHFGEVRSSYYAKQFFSNLCQT